VVNAVLKSFVVIPIVYLGWIVKLLVGLGGNSVLS